MQSPKKFAISLYKQLLQFTKKTAKFIGPYVSKTARRKNSAVFFECAGLLYRWAGDNEAAETHLRQASLKAPDNVRLHLRYAESQQWQGRQWRQLEILESKKTKFNGSFAYCMSLGQLQLSMYRLTDAKASFEQALFLNKRNAKAWWLLGATLDQLGHAEASGNAYAQAQAHSWSPSVRTYGVGVWFAQAGQWERAITAYARRLQSLHGKTRLQAGLSARIGQAHGHLLDWPQACVAYQQALQRWPKRRELHERLAWAQAQAGQWPQVQATCSTVLSAAGMPIMPSRKRLHGLLALGLQRQHQYLQAAEQFQKTYGAATWWRCHLLRPGLLPLAAARHKGHAQLATPYLQQARRAWAKKNWTLAAANLEMAVQRWPAHAPRLFVAWGQALAAAGNTQAACHAYAQASLYRWPVNAAQQKLQSKKALRLVMEYAEYLERLPVSTKVVVYESYSGVSIGCNPYAIYQAIVDAPDFAGWTHVWVLNDTSRIPADCAGRDNVVFVARDSQVYQRYLAMAGWLINNSTFPTYFIRRDAQRYLNTWHGTPFKTLGKDIRGNFMEHKNVARNLLQATHILSPNPHTTWVLIRRNDIEGLYQGRLAETGYPRNDWLVNATTEQKAQLRDKLGLRDASKPLVLYAPTWRGVMDHPEVDAQRLVADLQALQRQNCQIVFRGHYFAEKALAKAGLGNVHIAPHDVDTSKLLAITDVLVTDYSSIFFDYLPTGRPILFYAYDEQQYRQERGLYFDMEEMPGPNCATIQQLETELARVLEQILRGNWRPDAHHQAAQQKFSPYEDGQATQRAVAFFFKNHGEAALHPQQDTRKTLLFFAGHFAINGITTAVLNLIGALDATKYRVVVVIDSGEIARHAVQRERLNSLPEHVQIIGRVGRQVCNIQEREVIDVFMRRDALGSAQWQVYAAAFQREFRRMFGTWQADHVINYDGYARFWVGLLGCGPARTSQRLIYLHNDMYGEWQTKYPHLAGVFALYSYYDLLVSVSAAISQVNQERLSLHFGVDTQHFTYADNIPDFAVIRQLAQEPLDAELAEWLAPVPNGQAFISIGRLSPEKNHGLLLQAFAILLHTYPQARLVILGQGLLYGALKEQIARLHIGHAVRLAGIRVNPFPLLSRCDCFVLPSLHEGLGMVLLEAMALGKAIVATNIAGVRELVQQEYGELVEIDCDELAAAMIRSITVNHACRKPVDVDGYRQRAISGFQELLEV